MISEQQLQNTTSVIQAKFTNAIIVRSILLDVQLRRHTEFLPKHHLLTLVENSKNSTFAIIVFISKSTIPEHFTDLLIERAVPIDRDFTCDSDSIGSLQQNSVIFNINHRSVCLCFNVEIGLHSATFVTEVIKAREKSLKYNTLDHSWLNNYNSNLSSCLLAANMTTSAEKGVEIAQEALNPSIKVNRQRESILKYELDLKRAEYSHYDDYIIFVGTWNVNGKPPPLRAKALSDWLESDPDPPDIYAIGFQEIDLSKEAFLFNDTPREAEWQKTIELSTHSKAKYRLVGLARLVGIQLAVMIKYKHYEHVDCVDVDCVGTGILGKMGNKGGVAVSFKLHNTTLCFVNSHLAAHAEEVERRNQDYNEITSRILFKREPQTINQHDQVYWMGDLNYRVKDLSAAQVKQCIGVGDLSTVLAKDQLAEQKLFKKILKDYVEGDITFQPTYKYDVDSDRYDTSEKARAPAWTDRIFCKGKGIQQLSYRAHMALKMSDHKPVSASYRARIEIIDREKFRKVHESVLKQLDKIENEWQPQATIDTNDLRFPALKFREALSKSIVVANTGYVPVSFAFIPKYDSEHYCKPWLLIRPASGNIKPGDKCDIDVRIEYREHATSLQDILILHLDGGKDFFITISADCIPTCFNMSLTTLCKCPVPIRQLTPEQSKNANLSQSNVLYKVPRELWLLIDYLYRNALKCKDLFESQALHKEIDEIIAWLDEGSLDPIPGSVHAIAETLIIFLTSIREPVVPFNLQNKCADVCDYFSYCVEALDNFPALHRSTFLYICLFLQELLKFKNDNGFDVHGLSLLFSDVLMRTPNGNQFAESASSNSKSSAMNLARKKTKFLEQFLTNDLSPLIAIK